MKSSPLLAAFSAFVVVFAFGGAGAQAQSTRVQEAQPPQQSEQSREQDRSRAEDVKIGRDWKAQGGENDHSGQAAPDDSRQTVGRDWRARPENRDRQ
ncbi:hypothetical protein IVB18_07495 [Bradyrhizobium sp. 186]|uniref:hypothetical protein n=1 Tax=Bradyrhizobium sp. 186 TaxID=2782654 RepID=UPI002000CB4A|nr:hypothetical protein [Bradyrhizobium sp. 186]UPK37156.1 hypothetical protein IVB18_07495 [Bradyrhizobium sp. 186]